MKTTAKGEEAPSGEVPDAPEALESPAEEVEDAGWPRPGKLLIAGLGNPGESYRSTRHNVGFEVIEELARRRGLKLGELECNARLGEDGGVLLAQPQTYMNRSGHALRCLVEGRSLAYDQILVVYDEVQLPLGRLRLRPKGSPAGHRGMESVLDSLRSDEVPRLRLGVAGETLPEGEELASYVLAPFTTAERQVVQEMIIRAADACEEWMRSGIAVAMNRHNG